MEAQLPPPKPDLVHRYESRNKQLERELRGVAKRLSETEKDADGLRRELHRLRAGEEGAEQGLSGGRSAYMLQLLGENSDLRKKLLTSEKQQQQQQQQECHYHHHHLHSANVTRSHEDLRTISELEQNQKHLQMHNRCLKNQVENLRMHSCEPPRSRGEASPPRSSSGLRGQSCEPGSKTGEGSVPSRSARPLRSKENLHNYGPCPTSSSGGSLNERYIRSQEQHIKELEERVDALRAENKDLKKRIDGLCKEMISN